MTTIVDKAGERAREAWEAGDRFFVVKVESASLFDPTREQFGDGVNGQLVAIADAGWELHTWAGLEQSSLFIRPKGQ